MATRTIEFDLTEALVEDHKIDRTRLTRDLLHVRPNVHIPYVKVMYGVVNKTGPGRQDIGWLSFHGPNLGQFYGNVFINPDGSFHNEIQNCSPKEREFIKNKVAETIKAWSADGWYQHQQRWYNERPWEKVDGMTVQDAIAYLTKAGFPV